MVELQQATSIYGGYPVRKREREEKARRERITREQPAAGITPTPCSLPGLRRKETITVAHAVDVF